METNKYLSVDQRFMRRRIFAGVLLLNLLVVGIIWFSLQNSRTRYEEQAIVTTRNLSQVLDKNITSIIEQANLALLAVRDEAEHQLAEGAIRQDVLNNFIVRLHARIPELISFRATDASGDAIYGVKTKAVKTTSLAHRDYFTFLRDNPTHDMVISKPLVGGISGKWMIILSRRINAPDGSFAGLVYGGIGLETLTQNFKTLDIGSHGAISLLDGDLSIVASYPELPSDSEINRRSVSNTFIDLIKSGKSAGTYKATSNLDGIERVFTYRKLDCQQIFYVNIGLAPVDYLSGWHDEVVKMLLFLAFFSTVSVTAALLIHREWRKKNIAEHDKLINEQKYRLIFNSVGDAIAIHDSNAVILAVNSRLAEYLGYSVDELMKLPASQVDTPEQREFILGRIEKLMTQGQLTFETEFLRKDGSTFPCEVNARLIIWDDVPAIISICRDISDRKMAEEQLKALNTTLEERVQERTATLEYRTRQLESMLESTLDGILMVSNDGMAILSNKRFSDMWQISQSIGEEKNAQKIFEWVTKYIKVPEEFITRITWLYENQDQTSSDEIELVDGRILDSYSSPLVNNKGDCLGRTWFFRDITDIVKLQKQLQQSQKLESLGRLAGGVAHDYNNKLTIIMGYAQMASDEVPKEYEVILDYLKEIKQAAEISRDITAQLLAFSRQQIISPCKLDPNTTINNMQKTLARLIGDDIKLIFKPCDDVQCVFMDSMQMDQILMNLVVNAHDAMPGGGTLTIETSNCFMDHHTAQATGRESGHYVTITVSDSGCGIAEADLAQIFDPFFTTKEMGKGTGLGLATIHGIVTQNNGYIDVDSSPGTGTTFKIYIPCYPDTEQSVHAAEKVLLEGNASILLVEDDDSVRRVTAKQLRQIGYEVTECSSPSEATELFRHKEQPFELILSDIIMPDMNGREMMEQIRMFNNTIKVIYMSGYSRDIITQKTLLSEQITLLQKPVDIQELHTVITALLEQSSE